MIRIDLCDSHMKPRSTFYYETAKLREAAPTTFNEQAGPRYAFNNVNTKTLSIFLTWIDKKEWDVCEHIVEVQEGPVLHISSIKERWNQFLTLNQFAERITAPRFQSAVLGELVHLAKILWENCQQHILYDVNVDILYNESMPGSPLRRLLVDLLLWRNRRIGVLAEDFMQILSADFTMELLEACMKAMPASLPRRFILDLSTGFKKELLEAGIRAVRSSADAAPWNKDPAVYHGNTI